MVQQLSLVATIGKNEFSLTINSLIALTGQKPKIVSTQNSIYKPIIDLKYYQNSQAINNSINLNQIEQFLIKICQPWDIYNSTAGAKNPNLIVNEILRNDNKLFMEKVQYGEINICDKVEEDKLQTYSFQISDIPAAGKRKVSSQTIYEVNINQSPKQLNEYLANLGYTNKQSYLVKGLKFVYSGNIILEIFQVFIVEKNGDNGKTVIKILDSAENWFLKVYINVAKITDVGGIIKATNDLIALQKELDGLIKLKIPERSCMDSRGA